MSVKEKPTIHRMHALDTCFYCYGDKITASFRGKTLTLVCGECNTGWSLRNVELVSTHFEGKEDD